MINLLPPETRETILYARRNTKLLHWSAAMMFGIVGIVFVVVFGYVYLDQTTKNIDKQIAQTRQELKDQKLEETQARVEDISDSFKLVTQVLSRQVLFSKLIPEVGAVMPNGTALSNLSLSNELEGGIDLEIVSTDYESATQVQVNLQDPENKIFKQVDIINISCGDEGQYPCSGTYRALFGLENSYTLLGDDKEGSTP